MFKLRNMNVEDLPLVLEWRNLERVRNGMYTDHIITEQEHINWFNKSRSSAKVHNLICEFNSKPVGVVNITDISIHNETCSWSIYIGDERSPKGSGYQMGKCALEYIFNILNLHKVYVEVICSNIASLKFHKKLGFKEEGVLKKHIIKNNILEDVILLSIFLEETK